jgi:hypothetical protein
MEDRFYCRTAGAADLLAQAEWRRLYRRDRMNRLDTKTVEKQELSADGLELIRQLQERKGARCHSCSRSLCPHQVLASMALGAGGLPRCPACLAAVFEQDVADLVNRLTGYFEARPCYWEAWRWASQEEGVPHQKLPPCLLNSSKRS